MFIDMPKITEPKQVVEKIISELDSCRNRIEQLSNHYIGRKKECEFFQNMSHEIHKITEMIDEFNLNL